MRQCRYHTKSFPILYLLVIGPRHHPAVTYKNYLLYTICLLHFCYLVRHRPGVLRVAGEDLNRNRTAFGTAKKTNYHLFVSALAVAIIPKRDYIAVLVLSLKITARDIVQNKATICKMSPCQRIRMAPCLCKSRSMDS